MAIKLDLHIAYDKVNRRCIIEVMRRLGFSNRWCSLIEECISNPTFSIIINDKATLWFSSNSGIRQGDPLSPFLFLFSMMLLDDIIKEKITEGKLEAMSSNINKDISLISCVDDVMLVAKAEIKSCDEIWDALDIFKSQTRLQINVSKSHIMFSSNINIGRTREIINRFRFKVSTKVWGFG